MCSLALISVFENLDMLVKVCQRGGRNNLYLTGKLRPLTETRNQEVTVKKNTTRESHCGRYRKHRKKELGTHDGKS